MDFRTESQLVRLEAKSKELRAKMEFCYNSIIIDERTLATYIDSEIFDAYKMNSIMLKQAEKLLEIHHATDETFIRTVRHLTPERKKQMEELFQNAHKAYSDILETIKNVKMEMRNRSLVTHNMPSHIAKNIVMPQFDGENLPHIHFFKKEINLLLEKQNIAKSSRGFFIRGQIKGAAATVLTTELKNHSDPSDDVIYQILETHYGEGHYILGLLAREHAKIGKIPGDDKDWSRIYKTTTKHVALIRQMTALEEAQTGEGNPVDGQYITGLFYYLGQGRQAVLANQQRYFTLSDREKYQLLKRTFTELELNSSKAQVSNSNIQRTETGGGFAGISEDMRVTGVQRELEKAIEQIKQAGRPQYQGTNNVMIPPIIRNPMPNMTIRPPVLTRANPPTGNSGNMTLAQVRCYKCDYLGHVAADCRTDRSLYNCNKCGVKGSHVTSRCPGAFPRPQQSQFGGATNPNNIQLPNINQLNQPQRMQHTRFSGAPGSLPRMSCTICETKAELDNVTVQLVEHPKTIKGTPLREACPTLVGLPSMRDRVDLLNKLGICLACIKSRLSDPSHNGDICDLPFPGLLCSEPRCKIRYTLCTEHKGNNKNQLDYITQLYNKMGVNMSFLHTIEKTVGEAEQQPSILLSNDQNYENPSYWEVEQLLESIESGVKPMNDGSPHFILFRMQGLQGRPVVIAYDTCAAFSIFRRDVLGSSIAAVEMETHYKHYVKGIGGRQESKLFCALIPLAESNKHQMISCHSVDEITEIRTQDISQVIDFITMNQNLEHLTTHPTINDELMASIQGCFNFAELGEFIRVDGLIGMNDFTLAPKLALETSIGVNFYKMPIKAFANGPRICLGGSIPDKLDIPEGVSEETMDIVLSTSKLNGSIHFDAFGNPKLKLQDLDKQDEIAISNMRDPQFIEARANMYDLEGVTRQSDHLSIIRKHRNSHKQKQVTWKTEDNDDNQIFVSDAEDFMNEEDYMEEINQIYEQTNKTKVGHGSNSNSRLQNEGVLKYTYEDIVLPLPGKTTEGLHARTQEISHKLEHDNPMHDSYKMTAESDGNNDDEGCDNQFKLETSTRETTDDYCTHLVAERDYDVEVTAQHQEKSTIKKDFYKIFLDKDLLDFRCRKCQGCKTCKGLEKRANISLKGEIENAILEQSVTIDIESSKLVACLPLPSNYEELLGDNRQYCEKRLRASLKRLTRLGVTEKNQLKQSVQKLIDRGFICNTNNLSESETAILKTAKCQYHIPTGIVFKPSSLSTPARLVLDASAKTSTGYALNDLLPKGDINLNMTKLVQVWHLMKYGVCGDLSSFYNRIYLTPELWHIQRFLWIPDLDADGKIETFVIRTLIYGVKSSGTQCEFAVKKICQIHPRLRSAMGIGNSKGGRYVDDLANSYPTKQEMETETEYTIDTLKKYGLYLKSHSFARSGEEPAKEISKDGTVGIGSYTWHPESDYFTCNTPILFIGNKVRGSYANLRIFEGTTEQELYEFFPKGFTLREMLSRVASHYDAGIGVLTPLIAELRGYVREGMVMNRTSDGTTDWEASINDTLMKQMCKVMIEIIRVREYKFPRCQIKAELRHGKGILMTFVDSGDYETIIIYISFETESGNSCSLVTSKSYLKKGEITVPKSELNACALGAQITAQVRENLSEYISEVYLFSDSSVSVGWIGNHTGVLLPFHRNRVAAVLDVFDKGNVYHVVTNENPADLISRRGIRAETLRPDGPFYNGQPWILEGITKAKTLGIIKGIDEYSRWRLEDNQQFKQGLKIKMFADKNIDILRKIRGPEDIGEEDLPLIEQLGHGEYKMDTEEVEGEMMKANGPKSETRSDSDGISRSKEGEESDICRKDGEEIEERKDWGENRPYPTDGERQELEDESNNLMRDIAQLNNIDSEVFHLSHKTTHGVETECTKIRAESVETRPELTMGPSEEPFSEGLNLETSIALALEYEATKDDEINGASGQQNYAPLLKIDNEDFIRDVKETNHPTPARGVNDKIEETDSGVRIKSVAGKGRQEIDSTNPHAEEKETMVKAQGADSKRVIKEYDSNKQSKDNFSEELAQDPEAKHSTDQTSRKMTNIGDEEGRESLEHKMLGISWLKNKLTGPRTMEDGKMQDNYYIEIEVKESNNQIQAIQQLVTEALPQYMDYKRKTAYPHITIIHFTLRQDQHIGDVIENISRRVIWPSSFWMKLDMLEQFQDGSIHLTVSQPYELEGIHEDIKEILIGKDVKTNLVENNYRPHLALFHKQGRGNDEQMALGFKELITTDELLITRRVTAIRLLRQRDYNVQHTWELSSKEDDAMRVYHGCLMVSNERGKMNSETINKLVSQHNQSIALVTLRSHHKGDSNTTKNERERERHNKEKDGCEQEEKGTGIEKRGDRTLTDEEGVDLDKIHTIEPDSDESDNEDDKAGKVLSLKQKDPEDKENGKNALFEDVDSTLDIEFNRTIMGVDREEYGEDSNTREPSDDFVETKETMIRQEYKEIATDTPLNNPKGLSKTWGKETIKQIENTRLLYNPLKYTFRKGIRIGSIIVAFLHKLLRKFPEKQEQLIKNTRFTTNTILIRTMILERNWQGKKIKEKQDNEDLRRIMEDMQMIEKENILKPRILETTGNPNKEKERKEFMDRMKKLNAMNMSRRVLATKKYLKGQEGNVEVNSEGITSEQTNIQEELILLADSVRGTIMEYLDSRRIDGDMLQKESKDNPLGLDTLNPKVNDKGWDRYPGHKHVTTVMGNLAKKIIMFTKSKEEPDEHMCTKIVRKVNQWRRYGESLCETAGRGRIQVKTVGRMILKDYNKFFTYMEKSPKLMTKMEDAANDSKLQWGAIMSRETLKNTDLLRKIPNTANYWNVMSSMDWSKTCMLVVMGCMTKQTQDYMRRNWSKRKLHQHVFERDGVMISNLRWNETEGPRERFQGEEDTERRFKNGTIGRVPILDKMSPWFITLALHIHHYYRVLIKGIKGIDVKHHGVTQNNLDMLQTIYAPGSVDIFKRIRGACFNCKKRLRRNISNAYGSIHHTQLATSSPFSRCHFDIAGPYFVKGNVSERTGTRANPNRIKTYVLVIVCAFSKAASLEIAETCEVSALADALTRHMCKFGPIEFVVSDRAPSQMKLLAEAEWREQVKGEIFTRLGFSYELVPVSSHSYNGLVENKIKQMKLLLGHNNFQNSNITITQLNSLLQLAANIMNSVPLACSKKSNGDPGLQVICPGHFLVPKRNLYRVLISPINISGTGQEYFREMEKLFEDMLSYYEETVIPATLHKPHHYKKNTLENIEIGDIVLFKKKPANNFSRDWSLGRISEVFLDRDNMRKSVTLSYCNLDGDDPTENSDRGKTAKSVKYRDRTYKFTQRESHRQTSELIKIFPLEEDDFTQQLEEIQKLPMGNENDIAREGENLGLLIEQHEMTEDEYDDGTEGRDRTNNCCHISQERKGADYDAGDQIIN